MGIESKSSDITIDFVKNILLQEVDFKNGGETAMAVNNKKIGRKKLKRKPVKCYDCYDPHYRNKCPLWKGGNDTEKSNFVLYSAFMTRQRRLIGT